jgi:type I restriction-modification system DNA methylase subunit
VNVARKPGHPQQVSSSGRNGTNGLGFEAKLWAAADALRNNMDAAEDKHVVLGLIFLRTLRTITATILTVAAA